MLDANPRCGHRESQLSQLSFQATSSGEVCWQARGRKGKEGSHNTAAQPKSCSEQQQLAKTSVPGTTLMHAQMFLGVDSAANILQLTEP